MRNLGTSRARARGDGLAGSRCHQPQSAAALSLAGQSAVVPVVGRRQRGSDCKVSAGTVLFVAVLCWTIRFPVATL